METARVTSLVTGSNRGIGLELCRQLAARGGAVVAACRTSSPELDALARDNDRVHVVSGVDVTRADSVDALAGKVAALGIARVDLVVSNAGIMTDGDDTARPDFAAIATQLEVNAVGALRVAVALLPRMGEGGKIAFITSRMGSIGDNTSGGSYGYRMSKAALNIAAVSLARDLAPRGIAVAILHPGMVKTDMAAGYGQVDVDFAVRGLLARIDALTLADSGTFLHAQGHVLPW